MSRLKIRNALLAAQSLVYCATALVLLFVLVSWVEQLTRGGASLSPTVIAVAALASTLPVFLVAAMAHRLVPRWSFERILTAVIAYLVTLTFVETPDWALTWTSFPAAALTLLLSSAAGAMALLAPSPRSFFGRSRPWLPALAAALWILGGAFLFFTRGAQLWGLTASYPGPSAVSASGEQRAPDVVLITLDTLRADRMGGEGSLTPALDRFATEGALFHRALAAAPWTVPSIASILTGHSISVHGAGYPAAAATFRRSPLRPELITLAERFRDAGYSTQAVVANPFLSSAMGMDQGFDRFDNLIFKTVRADRLARFPVLRLALYALPPGVLGDTRAETLTEAGLDILATPRGGPLFLWLHYIDPHVPYLSRPERAERFNQAADTLSAAGRVDWREQGFRNASALRSGDLFMSQGDRTALVELYDRGTRYLDAQLAPLFEALRARRQSHPTVVAVVSDHGEEFWEHGGFEHGHDYYQEVTRVPLIFWGEGVQSGAESKETVGHIDLAPTLFELAGLPADRRVEGSSLVPAWRGEDPFELSPRISRTNLYGLPAVLVEDGGWRYILRANGARELYDLAEDPFERLNLAHSGASVTDGLHELAARALREELEYAPDGSGGAEDQTEALRSLGYVR